MNRGLLGFKGCFGFKKHRLNETFNKERIDQKDFRGIEKQMKYKGKSFPQRTRKILFLDFRPCLISVSYLYHLLRFLYGTSSSVFFFFDSFFVLPITSFRA